LSTTDSPRSRRLIAVTAAIVAGVIVAVLYVRVQAPREDTWGATAEDLARPLPGDELLPPPYRQIHHAVTIDASPEQVWPWLIQLGRDRAGFYSYQWLENIFLAGIHNREEIRPEWQSRAVGDLVPAVQPNYLGGIFGDQLGWRVNLVRPDEALGLELWGTLALVRLADGRTRLIARQRRGGPEPPVARLPVTFLLDPSHFVMERRMLLRIKELAEGRQTIPDWLVTLAGVGWLLGTLDVTTTFVRRRRWLSLAACLIVAALVWWSTGDPLGALAAFMGLGLALVGVALLGWWAGVWIVGLGVFTYLVLALAYDAWVVFGLAFAALGAVLFYAQRRGLIREPARGR
jgi:hypothetical protein